MTHRGAMIQRKRPARRRRPGKRKRGIPIQVYVSAAEHRELAALAAKRAITVSSLVRRWIRKATAAANARGPKPVYEDPRQLRLA